MLADPRGRVDGVRGLGARVGGGRGGGVGGGGELLQARGGALDDLLDAPCDGVALGGQLVDPAAGGVAGRGQLGQPCAQRLLGVAQRLDLAAHGLDHVALDRLVDRDRRVRLALLEQAPELDHLRAGALLGGAELVALAAGLLEPAADLVLLAAQLVERGGVGGGLRAACRARSAGTRPRRRRRAGWRCRSAGVDKPGGFLAQRGELGPQRVEVGGAGGAVEAVVERLDPGRGGLERVEALGQRGDVGGAGLERGQLGAERVEVGGSGLDLAQRGDLGAQGLERGGAVAQRRELGAQRLHAGAGRLGVARQLVQAAAILAGLGALDGDGGELLAQGVGLALDVLDALQRGGQLGACALGLTGAVALEPLERLGELGAGGLRGLFVLGADLLELDDQVGLADVAGAGAAALDLGQPRLDVGARLVGAAAGFDDRLLGAALGLGDRGRQAGVGGGGGLRALALEAVEAGGELGARGLGDVERAAAVVRGLLGVHPGALEALQAGEQLAVLGLVDAGRARRAAGQRALDLGAQGLGLALGGVGAALGGLARLLELAGEAERDALELVDPLHRRQQARHHGGGVVEVGDRALEPGVEIGQALLDVGVGLGARGVAGGQRLLDPRGRRERAEDDERAGGAPALPRLGLGLERLAQRAHDDRVLRAHALQHQVHRELEAEILQEQREVEALVELDGDEDRLHRERRAVGVQRRDLDAPDGVRRLAGLQEPAPGLGGGAESGLWISVWKNDWPSTSAAGRPNSSSAGSDHLETDPCPSVSTKYPPMIWRRMASSGSAASAAAVIT